MRRDTATFALLQLASMCVKSFCSVDLTGKFFVFFDCDASMFHVTGLLGGIFFVCLILKGQRAKLEAACNRVCESSLFCWFAGR